MSLSPDVSSKISCFITEISPVNYYLVSSLRFLLLSKCYKMFQNNIRHKIYSVGTIFRESKGQSAAMPACTLAFASLCLQNALLLLKSAEVIPVHEPESVLESQLAKEDESFSQETDASRYVFL